MPVDTTGTKNERTAPDAKRAQLPHDIEAEQSVLAACLLNAEACDELVVTLKPENFFRPAHRTIFESIYEMVRDGLSPDVISLADKLKAKDQLEFIGGRMYLVDLNANTFALTNWRRHAEIVKRTAIQRDLIKVAAEINALAYDAPEDTNDVVGEAEQALFKVTEKRVASDFRPMSQLVGGAFEELQAISERGDNIVGVPSGFTDVDNLFQGFRPGDLVILAARPGIGKTAFALNIAVNAARLGTSVAFFSLEMPAEQLTQRILSSEARVSLSNVRGGKLSEGDWGELFRVSNMLTQLDIAIDDTPGLTLLQARAKARRQMRKIVGTEKKGLIIIDYLQLMQPSVTRRDGNRAAEVGEISRGLKILAKELKMPVIALSQLNRVAETRTNKRPQLSDLRESGSIEQDADIVMFIDRSRDEMEAAESGRPELGRAELIVSKHRNGPIRDIPLAFNAEFTNFNNFIDDSRVGSF